MSPQIPAWVPASVASIAARLYDASEPGDRTVVERLVYDGRMHTVWMELRKRVRKNYRKTERFSHPVAVDALGWLRHYANFCQQNAAYWRKQGDETRAAESEKDAAEMRSFCPQDAACVSLFSIMFVAATLGFRTTTAREWQEWQKQAGTMAPPPPRFVVQRRRGDQPAVRACGIAIGSALETLFGSPCYRLTATATAVALNIDRPPPGVREWFRQR